MKRRLAEIRWWHLALLSVVASILPIMQVVVWGGHLGNTVLRAKSDLAVTCGAIDQFRLDVGRYPTEAEGLSVLSDCPRDRCGGWAGPYVLPGGLKDPWGNAFVYRVGSSLGKKHYTVTCLGADGKPGGQGVDADLMDGG